MSKSKTGAQSHPELMKSALSLFNATSHLTDHKVAAAREGLNQVIESIGDGVEEVEEAALDKVKQARTYIRENPYKAAVIAIGICGLISLAISLRNKRD